MRPGLTPIRLVCYILAAFCFALATAGVSHPRVNFTALGLFFMVVGFCF